MSQASPKAICYKFPPADFENISGLSEDLRAFYDLVEKFKAERSITNKYTLRSHWEDLFFLLKHRELDGSLDPVTAQEIRDYLEELAHD